MEGFVSVIAFIVAVLVLAGFYNLCRQVRQIRDDHRALRIMIEEELKRAARQRNLAEIEPPA